MTRRAGSAGKSGSGNGKKENGMKEIRGRVFVIRRKARTFVNKVAKSRHNGREDIVEACALFLSLEPEKFQFTQEKHSWPLRRNPAWGCCLFIA